MRIHRLEVQAFGPFAERVHVDVDALAAGGLFLVHGPTGSGKTSLLDAVCFALYGDVPGARRKQGLRSDHAAPEVAPEVVLEVTVGVRRLRVTRSPEWRRPKRRGTGSTREQARVLLEERTDGGWRTLSTRNDEVADVVLDVLGMGLSQFAQVVLLPQGEFAAFLRATPEERREVLERLFDIDVYRDVEDWLTEHRRALAAGLDRARTALAADLTRVEDALAEAGGDGTGPSSEGPPLVDMAVDAVPGRLDALTDGLAEALTAAMADADAATGEEQLAQAALAEGRARDAARGRGLQARVRAAALVADEEEHECRLAVLAAAERAATVSGHLLAVERAEADLGRCAAELELRRAAVAARLPVADGSPATDLVGLADLVHRHDDAAAGLARQADQARRLAQESDDASGALEASLQQLDHTTAELADATAGLEMLRREVARLATLAAALPERALRLEAARERVRVADAVDADRAARAELAPALIAARDTVIAAQARLEDLLQRRLDGMAAQLAAGLDPGGPCPVCGSAEHPRPAVATDPVPDEEVDDAEARLGAARAALTEVEGRDTRLAAAVETRLATLGGADRASLTGEVAHAEEAVAAAAESVAAHDDAAGRLEHTQGRVEALSAQRHRLEATTAALQRQLDDLAVRAEATRTALAAAVEEHADCPCGGTDPQAHARLASTADAFAVARAEHDAATARLDAAAADLGGALAGAGFADAAEAAAARRPDAELDTLREEVAAHVREAAACRAVLEDPEVAAALDGEAPDLAALEESARAARRTVLATTAAQGTVERAARALARLRPVVVAACAEVSTLTARHARVRELADAVAGTGGDNTLRMRLTSFVLAARLEKVAALANERLLVMGSGRYLLEHTDDRAARGARSGLGLRVLDQWTGRTRDTATLSGGESFMASLALALGLADAVREEAGGLDLGTLFVDEGFGSLDEDSLEQVLEVLDGLREGGRAVGVVSHVADLRARIPHQAVVRKSATGSTVLVRSGDEGAAPAA